MITRFSKPVGGKETVVQLVTKQVLENIDVSVSAVVTHCPGWISTYQITSRRIRPFFIIASGNILYKSALSRIIDSLFSSP